MRALNWSGAPHGATVTQKKNFIKVQVDGLGVGLETAAATFLIVFLTRLGASNFQIGLVTAMPAIAGLFFSIAAGSFLQGRRNIVPWHSGTRLLYVSSYTLVGLAAFIVPQQSLVPVALVIRIAATLSLPLLAVAFNVVMNAVAGPDGRYALMSRRWSVMGLTSALSLMVVGRFLDQVRFPLNYQWVLIGLSVGGLISYYASVRIELPDTKPRPPSRQVPRTQHLQSSARLVLQERPFLSFVSKQFVYQLGLSLALPLFPLYYVREVQATDTWIGIINSAQTAILLVGFWFWTHQRQVRGARFVLLSTTLGLAIYPALVASTRSVHWITVYAGLAGILQAGLNLVFFDELMKTVPEEHSPLFVSVALTSQHLSTAMAPLLGSLAANAIGLGGALVVSGAISFIGFGLFALSKETISQ